ncbi:MAG: hypothetical protein DMG03_21870 [Acidobacteria bacterium]|nr:MAG: hypothetical protein DMG03_21870 [Acidobacteriota bacterium]
MTARHDVVFVSMPFGPLFSPSLALSLLQPQVHARGLACRVEYFTLAYAERVGHSLYSKILAEHRAMARSFVGEWIFSHALFDWPAGHDQRYLREVLRRAPSHLGWNQNKPPGARDMAALEDAVASVSSFVDWCAGRIVDLEPRLLGFTSVFQQHLASLALGANCEATMGVETVRQFPFVDAVVSGEADHVFAELASRVAAGDSLVDLRGVVTRASIAAAPSDAPPTAPAVTNLDALPYPEYRDFFDQFARSRFARRWQPSIFVETSRGCWWGERMHCTFCGLNGATMAYRSKSAPRALAEVTRLAESHPGCDIQVVDNILDLKYFRTLLPMLAERKLKVSLFYETKSNLKKDQVRLLRDAGVTIIQPGIESLSDNVLKQMKKGVSGLQNIQLLKWCKEFGVEPLWNVLLGFPGESPDDYHRMAELTAQLCHLPRPVCVTAIRLDRFSPNFNESDRLGFARVRPLPFYEFLYDLPESARRNLAYFFAYEYQSPQDVASYAVPLIRRVHAWKTTWRHSELVSIDIANRLVVFDTRPRAKAPISMLSGEDRDLYLACDAITDSSQVDASSMARLNAMVDRGLMLKDGARYLSLAVPIGDYTPKGIAAARLRAMFASSTTRDYDGDRNAPDEQSVDDREGNARRRDADRERAHSQQRRAWPRRVHPRREGHVAANAVEHRSRLRARVLSRRAARPARRGGDRFPVGDQVLGGPPGERLHGERRIVRAARPHRRGAEDAEIWRLMRKAPAIDDVGRGIVAHARSAVRVRADSHRAADRRALNRDRARFAIPLLHFSLREQRYASFVLLELRGDAADREAERILHDGIEIDVVVLVRERRLLDVRGVRSIGVLLDERLPCRSPCGRAAERAHAGGADRTAIRVHPQVAAADEIEARMIEVVVGPVVDGDALRGKAVPRARIGGKQRRHAGEHVVAEVVAADLTVIVR